MGSTNKHVTFSLLRPGNTLSAGTHLKATITGVQGLPTSNSSYTFRASFQCDIPNDGEAINDYMVPKDAGSTRVELRIRFGYSSEEAEAIDGAFDLVETARQKLQGVMGKRKVERALVFDVGGMKVSALQQRETGWVVELEGLGQRTYVRHDGEKESILPVPHISPTWFHTPAPSSPADSTKADSPVNALPEAGPVNPRLRPITTLPVPPAPAAHMQGKPKSGQRLAPPSHGSSAAGSKRSTSPEKHIIIAKRPRTNAHQRDSSDIGKDEVPAFPAHNAFATSRALTHTPTVVLAAPGAASSQAVIDARVAQNARHLTHARKRIQVSAQPVAGDSLEDVFGLHEDTGSEVLREHTPADPDINSPGELAAFLGSPGTIEGEALGKATPSGNVGPSQNRSRALEDGTSCHTSSVQAVPPAQQPGLRVVSRTKSNTDGEDKLERIRKQQAQLAEQAEKARMEQAQKTAQAQQVENSLLTSAFLNGHLYTPLANLKAGETRNFMGVVLDQPGLPKQARSGDSHMTVVLCDPTNGDAAEATPVTIFRQDAAHLPQVYPGIVMMCRRVKCQMFKEKIKGNLYKPGTLDLNGWAHMNKNGKIVTSSPDMMPSDAEVERMKQLQAWWVARSGPIADGGPDGGLGASIGPGGQGKSKSLASLRPADFADVTVKVLHIHVNQDREPRYELYITDGTVNPRPTRNFHGVTADIPPSAIWCLAVFGQQPESTVQLFQPGNYVNMRNVRIKAHSRTGELEMVWSEKLTAEQQDMGWRTKQARHIAKTDHIATQINARVNDLRKRMKENPEAFVSVSAPFEHDVLDSVEAGQAIPPIQLSDDIAKHVYTIHTDPISNVVSKITDIVASRQIPNKWRFHARVMALGSRQGGKGDTDYVVWWCKQCQKTFVPDECPGCHDTALLHAELRYRLWAKVENGEERMMMIIDGEAGIEFLPPLPPLRKLDNPNDKRKLQTQIREANRRVEDMLLGAKMDGQRSRPLIDWTVETVEMVAKSSRGVHERFAVPRVFGMASK